MNTRWSGLLMVLSAVPRLGWGQGGQAPAATRWARVTYLTATTAYIDAGRAEGLPDSGRVEVVRGDSVVAVLAVVFLATHQAACDLGRVAIALTVGDSVRFHPAAPAPAPDSARTAVSRAPPDRTVLPPGAGRRSGGARGRVGLFYLLVQSRDGSGARFTQPSGEMRLWGSGLGGTGLGIAVDARTRRTVQTRADGFGTEAQGQTRVYQAALSWQAPGSPLRFTAGRQYAPGIGPVGLVDGVSAQLDGAGSNGSGWDGGVFAGGQPEPINLGMSGTITDVGAYVRRHNAVGSTTRWGVLAGLSGSYLRTGTNREFLYLQGDYATRRLFAFVAQEVDYYRPWRRVGGEQAVSPTSTFASLQYRAGDAVTFTAGVDNRRSVRLYRDVVNPETAFDDAFRRGAWVGMSVRAGRFQAGLDGRASGGGAIGSASSATLSLDADRLTRHGLAVRSRSTSYRSAVGGRRGWLQAFTLGLEPGAGSVQLSGGWRYEQDALAAAAATITWVSADVDVVLARSWMLVASAYRERGGSGPHDLLYGGFSFRF